MVYSTDNILPVESTPSGQSNLVSVEYPCIPPERTGYSGMFVSHVFTASLPRAQLRNEVWKHWRSRYRQLKLVGMLLQSFKNITLFLYLDIKIFIFFQGKIRLVGPLFCVFSVKFKPDYVRYFAREFRVVSQLASTNRADIGNWWISISTHRHRLSLVRPMLGFDHLADVGCHSSG